MNRCFVFVLAVVLYVSSALLPAQEVKSPPSPPFVSIPPRATYEVVSTKKPGASANDHLKGQPHATRVRVSIWDGWRWERFSWSDGSESDVYLLDGLLYGRRTDSEPVRVEAMLTGLLPQTVHTGVAGFQWLAASNYVGEVPEASAPGFLFRSSLPLQVHPRGLGVLYHPNNLTDDSKPNVDVEAVVDQKTRRPQILRIDGGEYKVTFGEAPTSPIALPPEIKAAYEVNRKRAEKLTSKAPGR